jgi:serine/threonine protein kinase
MPQTHQIGKFQLRKVLGKGASGTVYLALDTFSGADVALKVLDPEIVSHPDFGETTSMQFMNEASLAGKLSHPHIAAILEAVVSDGSGYIAMEYVPGGDLSQFTATGRLLDIEDAIEIAYKSCGALDYAARQGIVHRDIKPANIMVANGTNIKVADFGAAYLHKAIVTQVAGIGTPYYMSPEMIDELPLGHHSDMFALGVVLYELFTGQRPFVAPDLEGLFRKILTEDPVPPSSLRKGLAGGVDQLLLRMMAKQPANRYATWADLALEVAHIGKLSVYQSAIPDSEKFTVLRKVAFLERLNDAEIWELVHAAQWSSRRPARQAIMREGEPGNSLFLLTATPAVMSSCLPTRARPGTSARAATRSACCCTASGSRRTCSRPWRTGSTCSRCPSSCARSSAGTGRGWASCAVSPRVY